VSLGGKAFSKLPVLPMIFAARIGPTPNIRVRLVRLSSTASWMLRSRSSSCRSRRRRTSRSRSAANLRRVRAGPLRGRTPRSTRAAFSAERFFGAPPARRSLSNACRRLSVRGCAP
jgi:hypothetical protein